MILTQEQNEALLESGFIQVDTEDGIYDVTLCGVREDGVPMPGYALTKPSETYLSNRLEEKTVYEAEKQAVTQVVEAKKTEVETLKQTIESKVNAGDFDPEYFAALGRYTVLTREVVL